MTKKKPEWKVRIRQIADKEMFEVYRKVADVTESQGMFPTQKEAYRIANGLNGKE